MTRTDADFERMKDDASEVRRYFRDCFIRWMAEGLDGAKMISELNQVSDGTLLLIARSDAPPHTERRD